MITLYSTGCPKCQVLEKKLNNEGIEFSISNDIDVLIEKGFMTAPVLEIDDEYFEFKNAIEWLKNRRNDT